MHFSLFFSFFFFSFFFIEFSFQLFFVNSQHGKRKFKITFLFELKLDLDMVKAFRNINLIFVYERTMIKSIKILIKIIIKDKTILLSFFFYTYKYICINAILLQCTYIINIISICVEYIISIKYYKLKNIK